MIPHGVEVFVALEAIDLRWSFDRLAGLVATRIGREARSGALFVLAGSARGAKHRKLGVAQSAAASSPARAETATAGGVAKRRALPTVCGTVRGISSGLGPTVMSEP